MKWVEMAGAFVIRCHRHFLRDIAQSIISEQVHGSRETLTIVARTPIVSPCSAEMLIDSEKWVHGYSRVK